jgi:cell division protease FtsH
LNQFYKNIMTLATVVLVLLAIFSFWNGEPVPRQEKDYSEFVMAVEEGDVRSVEIRGDTFEGVLDSGANFTTHGPATEKLLEMLREKEVSTRFLPRDEGGLWQTLLISWFPVLLILGLWFLLFRQMQSGGGKAMSFGKSRARTLSEDQQRATFADVAGVDEAKAELEEIVSFLRDPKKFTRLGGRIPKGVLLVGPPGTGKTLLARAIAGEAGVPFFSISGSDFVEMFVGVGASRVRDLFAQGKKNAPCIIFVDEIDAVGRHRGAGLGGGHDEREQTLNQLLVEMDGFESNEGVIIIAATNRPDVLDPAMLRPGRFDRHVVVSAPDLRGREAILKVHARRILMSPDVELRQIARGTPGFTGADLENLINEGALMAAQHDAESVGIDDLERAKDKVLMGSERRSMMLSAREKRLTAYHEGGHALVAMLEPHSDPVHKVTIIPRGSALGVTMTMPADDKYSATRDELLAKIRHCMGGRAAEEIVFEHFSTGAANDLKQATKLARDMVCSYGMSDSIGPVSLEDESEPVFLGRELGHQTHRSAAKQDQIDEEITAMLRDAYERAKQHLVEQRPLLDRIAESLLERETLSTSDLEILKQGGELPPLPEPNVAAASPTEASVETATPKPDGFGDKAIPEPEPVPS